MQNVGGSNLRLDLEGTACESIMEAVDVNSDSDEEGEMESAVEALSVSQSELGLDDK